MKFGVGPLIVALLAELANAETVTVWNTFTDSKITKGMQAIYDTRGPVEIDGDVEPEFELFPGGSFYDIDVNDGSIIMTLMENTHASNLIFPDGTFDTYYYVFDGPVASVELDGTDGLNAHATVAVLPPGYVSGAIDLFRTGIPLPLSLEHGGFELAIGPGTDLTTLGQTLSIKYSLGVVVHHEEVAVWNTFQDSIITGGVQALYDSKGPVPIVDGDEFDSFPGGSFYDINVSDDSITMTLKENIHATDLVFPPGRFDRYYYSFGHPIATAALDGLHGLNAKAKVMILKPGFQVDATDLFMTGLAAPKLTHGGIEVQLGPRTDLTKLGQMITISYTLAKPVKVPEGEVKVWNTFQDSVVTMGIETIYDTSGPKEVVAKFSHFPGGSFYNIEVTEDTITWTLFTNTFATNLVFPEGTFDTYYFTFGSAVATAELDGTNELNAHATVKVLPPGAFVDVKDLFRTGLPVPFQLANGGLKVRLGGGTDLTELGQHLAVKYTLAAVAPA